MNEIGVRPSRALEAERPQAVRERALLLSELNEAVRRMAWEVPLHDRAEEHSEARARDFILLENSRSRATLKKPPAWAP